MDNEYALIRLVDERLEEARRAARQRALIRAGTRAAAVRVPVGRTLIRLGRALAAPRAPGLGAPRSRHA
jgi:hypothetical protein